MLPYLTQLERILYFQPYLEDVPHRARELDVVQLQDDGADVLVEVFGTRERLERRREVDGVPVGGPHPVRKDGVIKARNLGLDRGTVRQAEAPRHDLVVGGRLGGTPRLTFSGVVSRG